MAKKTRKEDAASIVGASLAEEIDAKSKVAPMKSDVLIEMSESETPEETQELIAEVEKSEVEEVETPEVPAEAPVEVEKSESVAEPEVEKMEAANLPYGGATSMKEAMKAKEAAEEMEHVMGMWGLFSNVAWNIIDRGDVVDKKAAFVKALDEFKSMLAAKAMVEFSQASVVERSVNSHPLQVSLDALLSAVDNSLGFEGDVAAKLQVVQPTLTELGNAITDYVTSKSVASEPPAQDKDNLLEKITELIQPLSQSVQDLNEKVGILEAKSSAQNVKVQQPRIPQPRTLQSSIVQKAEADKPKPNSISDIVRRSVGIVD